MSAAPLPDAEPTTASARAGLRRDEGLYQAEHDLRYDRMLERPASRLMGAAPIDASSRVLDVGCGTGHSTRVAARAASSGSVVGIDISPAMVARARERTAEAGLTNVEYVEADATDYPFEPAAFDVAISQFGMMFFEDPVRAFANVRAALVPGAPLLFLCWQGVTFNEYRMVDRKAFSAVTDVPMPRRDEPGAFSLAEPGRVIRLLHDSGFDDVTFEDVHEPLWIGADASDALAFITDAPATRDRLAALSDADAERVLTDLKRSLVFRETPTGVWMGSAAWLVRARRPA